MASKSLPELKHNADDAKSRARRKPCAKLEDYPERPSHLQPHLQKFYAAPHLNEAHYQVASSHHHYLKKVGKPAKKP